MLLALVALPLAALPLAGCGNDSGTAGGGGGDDDPGAPDAGPQRDGAPTTTSDGGTLPEPTVCQQATMHSDLAWIQANVFTPSCATAMCHSGSEPEVGLRLDPGTSYNNLVNKGASTVSGWTRVVPGSLETSYLVVAFGRTPGPPPRDGFMPLGADPLCVEKLEAIERWILAGAPP
ncbi:MAG: hypothetical protein H0T89_20470 [Deltaproteobacteria bacterium]|nr:hypothetical protein [Deltaproteobacteria bacterium]